MLKCIAHGQTALHIEDSELIRRDHQNPLPRAIELSIVQARVDEPDAVVHGRTGLAIPDVQHTVTGSRGDVFRIRAERREDAGTLKIESADVFPIARAPQPYDRLGSCRNDEFAVPAE